MIRRLLPNRNAGVQMVDTVVRGSEEVRRETGAIKQQLQGGWMGWQSSKLSGAECTD
jgi:hypothetical protein